MRLRRTDSRRRSSRSIQAEVSRQLESVVVGQALPDEVERVWRPLIRSPIVRGGRLRQAEPDLRWFLCKNSVDDVAVDVGQAAIDSVMAEGQPLVIKAEQVQDRCVQVVD